MLASSEDGDWVLCGPTTFGVEGDDDVKACWPIGAEATNDTGWVVRPLTGPRLDWPDVSGTGESAAVGTGAKGLGANGFSMAVGDSAPSTAVKGSGGVAGVVAASAVPTTGVDGGISATIACAGSGISV